ncbi:transglycosylase SLT domain-containing protein [Paucibacter sp. APW11]|uniref:Transglycosylase SLT domain-containing protein n=1 Tax=Roseateles aquae TaxID=3077235 RepID=A0ABU3P7C1_9BURK|nr:transglycosylase SLT domain-containing protein [Paucibacter sp. APW11]MDT8998450.1 transglycosylase SLT domain-containing protein [Paucibacter sp. APW11]
MSPSALPQHAALSAPTHPRLGLSALTALLAAILAGCASTPTVTDRNANTPARNWVQAAPLTQAEALQQAAAPSATAVASSALLEDSLNPGSSIDLNNAEARADLWARVRRGFKMPELDNDGVKKAEAWYSARPDYVQRMTERGSRYLYHIIEEVERRGLPSELALLPFVESAFRADAQSNAKAVGMWQFMPATGRDFALKQNIFRDDRRDVLASTRAALDYLERLARQFDGDWQLALAAYNWGQGNVQKAIARNQKAGLPTDYDSIKMPDETRYYLPKLQAVKNIVLRPEAYGLALPEIANHPYFLSVAIERDIDVDLAARLAGMELEQFKQFNPQMNKPLILAASTPRVLLPYDNAETFVGNLAAHRGPLASWTAWVVPKTMKPADAARQVGMSEAELRAINGIPARMLVKQGSTLLVPRTAHRDSDVSVHLAENASMTLTPDAPPLRRVSIKAGKGETLAMLAKRQKVSVEQLASWNKLSAHAALKPGQQLVIYTSKPAEPVLRTAAASKAPVRASKPQRAKPITVAMAPGAGANSGRQLAQAQR